MWLEEVDSTNNEAKRRIAEIDNLSVIAALRQSAGRGQGDHVWLSAPGENLLFSLVLKFSEGHLKAADAFCISEAISSALVKFLAGYGIDAWIKLPNDIYVGSKKICGTLIENSFRGEWVVSSIVGIGLNVNQREFDPSLPNPTSMSIETEKAYDIAVCLESLVDNIVKRFE